MGAESSECCLDLDSRMRKGTAMALHWHLSFMLAILNSMDVRSRFLATNRRGLSAAISK